MSGNMRNNPNQVIGYLCLILLVPASGCRAIQSFGDSSQSITARGLSGQGFQAMYEGDWATAESLFLNAVELSEGDDRAHWGLAESYWNRGDRELAIQQMQRAVELSAGDPKLVQRLGRMHLELGRIDEADDHSQWALESDRQSAEAWALKGDCLKASEEWDDALAAYHRAFAIQPDFTQVQIKTAEIYLSQFRHDRVLATLDRVQDERGMTESPAKVDLLRGIAMRELGRLEDARRCFVRASEKAPSDATPHLQLAELALLQGKRKDAEIAVAHAREREISSVDEENWILQLEQNQSRIASLPSRNR